MVQRLDDAISLRVAWEEALRVRGCPPQAVLCAEPISDSLQGHLNACPWCEEEREDLKALGPSMPKPQEAWELSSFSASGHDAQPGDVVRLAISLSDWGPKDRYYNAPLVLVLESLPEPLSAFRVALVHDFPDLAGPWDVEVAPGIFAEPWNTFACLNAHWDGPIFSVPASVLNDVRQRVQNPWQTVQPEDTLPHEPRHSFLSAFCRLEVEVASFFAQRILEDLMIFQENPITAALESLFKDPRAFRTAFGPWLRLDPHAEPSLKTLLAAPWADERLPMAAAPAQEILTVRIVRLRESGPVLEAATGEISVCEPTRDGFLVGGRVITKLSQAAELHAVWLVSGREIWPDQVFLDTDTGYFRLFFSEVPKPSASPKNLCITVMDR